MWVHSLLLTLGLLAAPAGQGSSLDPAIKDFNNRVNEYWDLHKKVEGSAPAADKKKEPDPQAIINHEQALATGIRAARKTAAEGDIFTPRVQPIVIATIKHELSSGRGSTALGMILGEGNPTNPESHARVDLVVNAKYPPSAPLSTVPPSVLLALPKLPEGLQYRFVGRHLILFDAKANLIVDILRNAVR